MPYLLADFMNSDRLPTLPQVAVRVIELVQSEEPEIGELAAVIRNDPAIASRILRTSNSALLGVRRDISNVEDAIPQLGLTFVRTLVLGCTLAGIRTIPRNAEHAVRAVWRSSLTQAVFAENLAKETPDADPPTFFLAGMLQDVGILAALSIDADNYLSQVWAKSEFPNVIASESGYYGFDHADIGMRMCMQWGLKPEFCNAVFTHHHSHDLKKKPNLESALYAANLCAAFVVKSGKAGTMKRLSGFMTQHYGWSVQQFETMLCDALIQVHEAAAMFSCNLGELSSDQLIEDARAALSRIAQSDLDVRSQARLSDTCIEAT